MNGKASFSEQVQNLPPWLLISAGSLVILALLAAALLPGFLIERARRREVQRMEDANAERQSFFATQPDSGFRGATMTAPMPVENPQRFGALDVTFAGLPKGPKEIAVDSSPTMILALSETNERFLSAVFPVVDPVESPEDLPTAPAAVPLSEEPTEETPVVEPEIPEVEHPDIDGADLDRGAPRWATPTTEWDMAEIWEAEVIEDKTEAVLAFEADPLGSWYVPDEVAADMQYLPEADRVFWGMVALGRLTGVGGDVPGEFESWNLSLEGASA